MDAGHIIDALHVAGLDVTLTPERGLKVSPASVLTPVLRDLIRASRTVLIDLLVRMGETNDTAVPWRVSVAPGTPPDALARLRAASLALDKVQAATSPDTPDASCWPHSAAMNGAEIDAFTARLGRFTDKGLNLTDAEKLVDRLLQRDRVGDDRRVCLGCRHLVSHQPESWRCANWQVADVALRARDARLPVDLVVQLQRCNGFAASTAINPMSESEAAPQL